MAREADGTAIRQDEPGSPGRADSSPWLQRLRLAGGGAMVVAVALLIGYAAQFLRNAHDVIAYPFGIDYGEGIIWQQALLIPGPRMYGAITDAPFIVFHYPPVYHLAVRALASLGLDPLAAGRGLSVACTLAVAGLSAWLVKRCLDERVGRRALAAGCIIAGLLPLSLEPVSYWSVLMRVDMLALFLSFLGVALVVVSARRPGWLAVALPVFVLAVYTKQTSIAAPAAALAVSLVVNRRATIIAASGGAALGAVAFGWLEWLTGGGFGRHIISYNINLFTIHRLVGMVLRQWPYVVLLTAAISALVLLWRDGARAPAARSVSAAIRAQVPGAILTLWFLFAAAMVVMVGKEGSWVNYFIESMCVGAVLTGILAALGWHALFDDRGEQGITGRHRALLYLSLGLIVQLMVRPPFHFREPADLELTNIRHRLVGEIAAATQPVLSGDMVLLLRAGHEVPIEPLIFEVLAAMGTWNQTPFLQLLADRSFAFVVTTTYDMPEAPLFTPEMQAAIAQFYPRLEQRGPYTIHFPPNG